MLSTVMLVMGACLVGRASSASLRWPFDGLLDDDGLRGGQTSSRWQVTWRELSFRGWLDGRELAPSPTTTTGAPPAAGRCFPPGPQCVDKILVSPAHSSSCPAGQKKDNRGRCRSELGSVSDATNTRSPRGKKAVSNKKKTQKTKRLKMKRAKKNNAKKQKDNIVKKQ